MPFKNSVFQALVSLDSDCLIPWGPTWPSKVALKDLLQEPGGGLLRWDWLPIIEQLPIIHGGQLPHLFLGQEKSRPSWDRS